MRHEIVTEGFAFRLRPLGVEDAEFVLSLRTDPELSRFINPTSPDVADQIAWTNRYFDKPDDASFIVERINGRAEGAVSIYDIREDPEFGGKTAEWGRWILRRNSPAALECAILVYRTAFGPLGLDSVYCRTVAANEPVVAFHTSLGLETRRALPGYVELRGEVQDSVEQIMTPRRWAELEPNLLKKAERLARKTTGTVHDA